MSRAYNKHADALATLASKIGIGDKAVDVRIISSDNILGKNTFAFVASTAN